MVLELIIFVKPSKKYQKSKFKIIFSVHPNPIIRNEVNENLKNNDKILLVDSLNVFDMQNAIYRSEFVLTDSGGIQEECASINKTVLILRNETERQEILNSSGKLIGTKTENIVDEVFRLCDEKNNIKTNNKIVENPFGNGSSARKILNLIYDYFNFW